MDVEDEYLENTYFPSYFSQLIHALPHFNIYFEHVDDTFNVDSYYYLESLCIFGTGFIIWMFFTLSFLFYFLLTSLLGDRKRTSMPLWKMKVLLMLLISINLFVIMVGTLSETLLHKALLRAIYQFELISERFKILIKQCDLLNTTIGVDFDEDLETLKNKTKYAAGVSEISAAQSDIIKIMNEIIEYEETLKTKAIIEKVKLYEKLWSSSSMMGWCAGVFVCMVLMFAASWKQLNRGLAIVAVGAVSGLVVCWLGAALRAAVMLAAADACQDPVEAVINLLPSKVPKELGYMLKCEAKSSTIFSQLSLVKETITEKFRKPIREMTGSAEKEFADILQSSRNTVMETESTLDLMLKTYNCSDSLEEFALAATYFCDHGLPALFLQLLMLVIAGVIFSVTALVYIFSKRLVLRACKPGRRVIEPRTKPRISFSQERKEFIRDVKRFIAFSKRVYEDCKERRRLRNERRKQLEAMDMCKPYSTIIKEAIIKYLRRNENVAYGMDVTQLYLHKLCPRLIDCPTDGPVPPPPKVQRPPCACSLMSQHSTCYEQNSLPRSVECPSNSPVPPQPSKVAVHPKYSPQLQQPSNVNVFPKCSPKHRPSKMKVHSKCSPKPRPSKVAVCLMSTSAPRPSNYKQTTNCDKQAGLLKSVDSPKKSSIRPSNISNCSKKDPASQSKVPPSTDCLPSVKNSKLRTTCDKQTATRHRHRHHHHHHRGHHQCHHRALDNSCPPTQTEDC